MAVNSLIIDAIRKKLDNDPEIKDCCQKGFSSFEEMVVKVSSNLELTKEATAMFLKNIGYDNDNFPQKQLER